MTLAARLLIAFGVVAIIATALVGFTLREASRELIESGYLDRIDAAHAGVRQQLTWEAEALRGLLAPLCQHDTFVDRAHLELDRTRGNPDALDPGSRIALRHQVAEQAKALRLDELTLATGDGLVLGAEDVSRIGTKDRRLAALLGEVKSNDGKARQSKGSVVSGGAPRLRPAVAEMGPSLEVHCARTGHGVTLGLIGSRKIGPLLERLGAAYGVALATPMDGKIDPPALTSTSAEVVRLLEIPEVQGLRVVASVSREPLQKALARLDRDILATGATVLAIAIVIAVVLARSLSRPIVALARETREVMNGEPRKVQGRGGQEMATLAAAFNRTLDELATMRRRLATAERIAARREIARQVAHEIKNPLAPIRAAVETLRRLRDREDPAFDDYFEEATATVLQEVHRIANIVGEFTRFARLPPPNPELIDLVEVARRVVTLHSTPEAASDSREEHVAITPKVELSASTIPKVSADRDQLVQVLTNLIQNGLEAATSVRPDPRVVLTVAPEQNDRVRLVVRDNGPGVAEEMIPRLFEPYATTKEKGTGLGLAIVQRIVFEHGGEIRYRKAQKGGAVFEIWLPIGGPPLLEKPLHEQTARPLGDTPGKD
ncbi:two-component sensor kinase [Chondromyces crocatus]|uniref:histidine kinase n=2 Tax=Chondromyces crocatus TaxID=52 RepID=A0A0K1E7F0_CHOCO|nr:two-component sensor kinase [Chondromyces crocatus]